MKTVVKFSILLFVVFSLCIAFFIHKSENDYSGLLTLNLNVEGTLLFLVFAHFLFSIDNEKLIPIYKHHDFWIAAGILIFNGGVFVFFVLYPLLRHVDASEAGKQYGFILQPLNVFLYFSIIVGMLCLQANKKFLAR